MVILPGMSFTDRVLYLDVNEQRVAKSVPLHDSVMGQII